MNVLGWVKLVTDTFKVALRLSGPAFADIP